MVLGKMPQRCKTIVLRKAVDKRGPYKFDAVLEDRDIPSLEDGQILLKIEAAGFNHRDVRLRRTFLCAIVINFSRFGYGKACTQVSQLAVSTAQTGQVC
jgi:NADPH:quinone reductase-like Zn-dependent oxidoreductase